ncbi:hypothetical protein, partial [Streptomyces sp. ECR2.10]
MTGIPRRWISRSLGASCLTAALAFSGSAAISIAAPQAFALTSAIAQDDPCGSAGGIVASDGQYYCNGVISVPGSQSGDQSGDQSG